MLSFVTTKRVQDLFEKRLFKRGNCNHPSRVQYARIQTRAERDTGSSNLNRNRIFP